MGKNSFDFRHSSASKQCWTQSEALSSLAFSDSVKRLTGTRSLRNYARLGSILSVYGMARIGSSFSVLDFIHLGSTLSLRSFTALGSSLSVYGLARLGSSISSAADTACGRRVDQL